MSKSKEIRYKENPFLKALQITTAGKRVTVNVMGDDDNVLVNQSTGEVKGTVVTTYKAVDDEQFVKLFTQNIALTFSLNAAGIKAFNVLMFAMQSAIRTDLVALDKYMLEDFIEAHKDKKPPLKLSEATFMRGLKELENAQIIAKTMRRGQYFINPSFVFNGDRIAFNTVIERKKTLENNEE
ncbi:replication/maintenance protein RepL [Vibrio vulnificus]